MANLVDTCEIGFISQAMTNESAIPPFAVVVGVDFSPQSAYAVREALKLAAAHPAGELHLVHAIPEGIGSNTTRILDQDVQLTEVQSLLQSFLVEQAKGDPELPDSRPMLGLHVRIGDPIKVLFQLTADVRASLLVVGTHGRSGVERFLLGSVSEKLIRNAHCPVLVARPTDYQGIEKTEQIEPPCDACLEVRRASEGSTWWCENHSRPRPATHVYSGRSDVSWVEHDSEVSATGISM